MRALITGAAGFVGRHMRAELEGRGWAVDGFDLAPKGRPNVYGDVRDIGAADSGSPLGNLIGSRVYDLVVHCAYAVGGRAAIDGVPMNLAHNLAADAALFEWAVATGQPRVLYFSSSAAYPVRLQSKERPDELARSAGPYVDAYTSGRVAGMMQLREDFIEPGHAAEPDAAYGWAKLTGERVAAAAAAKGVAVHVVRPFSGYGGDQGTEYPFPALLARVLRGDNPVEVWGSARQVRDWIHIDDVVRGALAVVDANERRPVNLCTGVPTSMADLVARMWQVCGQPPVPQLKVLADKPMGVFWRVGDPERMREHYEPQVTLAEGIERAADWLSTQEAAK